MSLAREARLRRFHQIGPWVLVGSVLGVLAVVEAVRRHVVGQSQLIYFAVLIPTIVLHEVSHGAVANACGDPTAKEAGRLTLNPLKHIDPIGTVVLPILLIVTTGTSFGWAKPVPISINRLRHPRNQAVLVGLAGPATNIVLALVLGFAWRLFTNNGLSLDTGGLVSEFLFFGGLANVIIAVFNLIPIPPLDGSALLERLLPASALPQYYRVRPLFMVFVLFIVLFEPNGLETLFNHVETIWLDIVQA